MADKSSTGSMTVGHLTIDHPINDCELTTVFGDATFRSYVVSRDMEESWYERESTPGEVFVFRLGKMGFVFRVELDEFCICITCQILCFLFVESFIVGGLEKVVSYHAVKVNISFKDYRSEVLVCKADYESAVLVKFFHHSVLELGQVVSAFLPFFVLFKEQFEVSRKL